MKYLKLFKYFITLNKTQTRLGEESKVNSRFYNKRISAITEPKKYPLISYTRQWGTRGYATIQDNKFNEWLAGVIDGDGCFLLSKRGYASLEIPTQLRDKRMLYLIKEKYGGSVKLIAGNNHLRYRLHHKAGLLNLINGVNGLLRNPTRILQLGRICEKYEIELKDPQTLTYYSG